MIILRKNKENNKKHGVLNGLLPKFYWAVSHFSKGIWDKYAKMSPEERLKGFAKIEDGEIIIPT